MHIDIDIPRPGATALLVATLVGGIAWWNLRTEAASPVPEPVQAAASSSSSEVSVLPALPTQTMTMPTPVGWPMSPYGMYGTLPTMPYGYQQMPLYQQTSPYQPMFPPSPLSNPSPLGTGSSDIAQAELTRQQNEDALRNTKMAQEILSRREQILRDQLSVLENMSKARGGNMTPEETARFHQSVRELTYLLQDKQRSEELLLESFAQIKESQDDLVMLTEGVAASISTAIAYIFPVEPIYGISAYFHDPSYFKRFGFAHDAIDIPTEQGTEIRAAATGIVVKAENNGLGYSSIMVQTPYGAYLIGHVSKILVQEGQSVKQGEVIALSGGEPGTPGAGNITTGPHVHFSIYENGKAVNPLDYLPAINASR